MHERDAGVRRAETVSGLLSTPGFTGFLRVEELMVSRGGIEPPTRRLRVCCSTN